MRADVLALLADLVALPSASAASNLPMVDYLERFLAPRGWRIHRQAWTDERGVAKANCVACSDPGGRQAELALCGHTDTVPWDEAWTDATRLVAEGDRLFGRGTCDMKGFLAATLAAVDGLDPTRLRVPLALVFTADEEVGCLGAKRLAASGLIRPRHAIVGEPTSLRPVRAGKGYGLAEVTVQGREAHSAFPDAGLSAIYVAAHIVRQCESLGGAARRLTNPFFDPPYSTLNIGTIQGGRAKNIVPGECRFLVEWRPLPGDDRFPGALREIVAEARLGHPEARIDIEFQRQETGFATAPASPLVRHLEATQGPAAAIAFNSEAPQFAALGAEVVLLGPGDMSVAHRTGEHVSRKELEATVPLLQDVIHHHCGPIR
jgi:acetylornithine deacetylase